MTFTSLTFVIFLPVVFALYWALRQRRAQNALLLGAGYFFYGWWDYRFCALMALSSLVDFTAGLVIAGATDPRRRKLALAASISFNLGLLGFFKYYNFFVENLRALAETLGWSAPASTLEVILPVGISFYTFQTISYAIEVYRGTLQPTHSLLDYATYVSFFPQLVAGPIERGQALLPQFCRDRHFAPAVASAGARQILWGFIKKMVVADNLARIVNDVYAAPGAHSGAEVAVATVAFAFQIYADFSAYSDIASGCARLLGIRLMRNFAYPYFSADLGEFWRRWHISLSTWFRDYLYIPLGGNRCGAIRRNLNVLITFVLSGLWHGASWNFVVWGAINGVGVLPALNARSDTSRRQPTTTPGGDGRLPPWHLLARMLLTFSVVCLSWIFFRATTWSNAAAALRQLLTGGWSPGAYLRLAPQELKGLVLIAGFVATEWVARRHETPLSLIADRPTWCRWATYTALFWGTIYGTAPSSSPFIYFQF